MIKGIFGELECSSLCVLSVDGTLRQIACNLMCAFCQTVTETFTLLCIYQKHAAEIINIGIASTGKFIMTCYSDTTIKIWDLKGMR